MLANERWKDLKGAAGYDVSRGVLVSTTDVRRSNTAEMYPVLTNSQARRRVTDRATADPNGLDRAIPTCQAHANGRRETLLAGSLDGPDS